MIDLNEYLRVDNSPINYGVKREEKEEPPLADMVKEFSKKLNTCGQLLSELSNEFCSILAIVSPYIREVANSDGVPDISLTSSRGVRNRGGRRRGNSTVGNRGSRKSASSRRTNQGAGMDYAGNVPSRQFLANDLPQGLLVQPSRPARPGTILFYFFPLIGLARSMSGIQHFRVTTLAIVFLQVILRGRFAVRFVGIRSSRWQ